MYASRMAVLASTSSPFSRRVGSISQERLPLMIVSMTSFNTPVSAPSSDARRLSTGEKAAGLGRDAERHILDR